MAKGLTYIEVLITYNGCNINALTKPLAPPLKNLEIVSALIDLLSDDYDAAIDGTPFDLVVSGFD